MMMMMMMMMLCVPVYNMKLAMIKQLPFFFTTFSAHTKMTAQKRGQDEVFDRTTTNYINHHLGDKLYAPISSFKA